MSGLTYCGIVISGHGAEEPEAREPPAALNFCLTKRMSVAALFSDLNYNNKYDLQNLKGCQESAEDQH